MDLYDYADTLNLNLLVTRHAAQDGRWSAHFEYVEVKQGSLLCGAYGNGKSPESAVRDYLNQIVGKGIVIHAMSDQLRQEFIVPPNLTFNLSKAGV